MGSFVVTNSIDRFSWKYIVVNYNKGVIDIYINGVKQGLINEGTPVFIDDTTSNIYLGTNGDEFFQGYIDQLQIYNHLLSEDQILINYNMDYGRLSGDEIQHGCYVCAVTPVDDDGNGLTRLSNEICL